MSENERDGNAERRPSGRTEETEVEGHRMEDEPSREAERRPSALNDEPEVEGHVFRAGNPERRWDVNKKG
jgi:hypothetical protein